MPSRSDIRLELRKRRSALPDAARNEAADQIARRLALDPHYRRSRRIAVYLAVNGEIDCTPLIRGALSLGKHVYLPCIQPDGSMRFRRWTPRTRLQRNRFGIPEPLDPAKPYRASRSLDIVLMPLVGFDRHGNRLGMGGGFYDRTFEWLRREPRPRPLRLIGLAYDFQQTPKLERAYWDVPLDGVATPSRLLHFSR